MAKPPTEPESKTWPPEHVRQVYPALTRCVHCGRLDDRTTRLEIVDSMGEILVSPWVHSEHGFGGFSCADIMQPLYQAMARTRHLDYDSSAINKGSFSRPARGERDRLIQEIDASASTPQETKVNQRAVPS